MGVKIRTMWMTPFYLFFGVLVIYIFQSQINLNKLKGFTTVFLILFIFSPFAYAYVSVTETDKRTDYNGKEIANFAQKLLDENDRIKPYKVFGNEWIAGNLCYHLESRPKCIIKNMIHNDVSYTMIIDKKGDEMIFVNNKLIKLKKNSDK